MRAIILAAGRGSRLRELTNETPKCLMEVAGETLLERQVRGYRSNGIEVAVVRGYLKEAIDLPGVANYDNEKWETTGLLYSLFCAEEAMHEGFFISYGDTAIHPDHMERVLDALDSGSSMAGVVDRDWLDTYDGRHWHPPSEAENVIVDDQQNMLRVGKVVPGDGSFGEYTGLIGVRSDVVDLWRDAWRELNQTVGDQKWGQTGQLRTAYVADMMQHLIDHGAPIRALGVRGGYREIDTPEDLQRCHHAVTW